MSQFNEYQSFIAKISEKYNLGDKDIPVAALGLAGETGEVVELIKKFIRDGNIDKQALTKELGDVLAYLSLIAHKFDISLEDVKESNKDKLNSRLERGTLRGSGNDR